MTNQEIIRKKFEAFRRKVHDAGNLALCDQMEDTLNKSLNLHEQLEGGYHAHHTTESDTHGWAVADGGAVVRSGASVLSLPNESASAEAHAKEQAAVSGTSQKAVFSVTMVDPFAGGTGTHEGKSDNPNDSIRFESNVLNMLMTSAGVNFPTFYRKNAAQR